MKARLLYRDRDLDLHRKLPSNEPELIQDLGLRTLWEAMASGDQFLFEVAERANMSWLSTPEEIQYRQGVLRDCLQQPAVVREIYDLAVETIAEERKGYLLFSKSPELLLHRSVTLLQMFVGKLRTLRHLAEEHAADFQSEGFTTLYAMLLDELSDEYFDEIDEHLSRLRFRHGVLVSAQLGKGNHGVGYTIRRPWQEHRGWIPRISLKGDRGFTVVIPERDEAGAQALGELRNRGVNLVSNALAQSTDHILSFFAMLRTELAFYVGCLNLYEQLTARGEPLCFPTAAPAGAPVLSTRGLYDVALALRRDERVVGNDVDADGKRLVLITGANQGGKSTFLRSVGLAQLMLQCGMFAPAESFSADVVPALFTHYKREEDATMESGKLDEELHRMSDIADQITPHCIALLNESFSSTNEREGTEIAAPIVRAMLEADIKVFFVTHSFELANEFQDEDRDDALFLRAERQADGRRTFRLTQGKALSTSFGEDLYQEVFGAQQTAGWPEAGRPVDQPVGSP